MKRTLLLTASLLILFASACKTDDPQLLSAGTADFSHYVAIGNSLSSGFTNQELTRDGQAYSYPMQISEKMALAGGGTFKQPYMTDNIGFGRRLTFDFAKGYPVSAKESLNPANLVNIAKDGPFNNMSVPGAKVLDLNSPNFSLEDLDLSKGGNPYYSRFAKIPGTSTIMQEVLAQKPTFFTLWIGNNDVLGYGLRGGDLTIGAGITPTSTYLGEMKNILDQLAGTKGVVANIPNVLIAPYFTAIKKIKTYNSLILTATQAADFNAIIAKAESDLTKTGTPHTYNITFVAGANAYLVEDPKLDLPAPYNFRLALPTDLFLLSLAADFSDVKTEIDSNGLGSFAADLPRPILHKYILDQHEQDQILQTIAEYNSGLADLVAKYPGMVLADMNTYMLQLKTGLAQQGFLFNAEFVTGGFFSYDGIHPTTSGATIIANKFIEFINAGFGSELPEIDLLLPSK